MRRNRVSRRFECRFKFPVDLRDNSSLEFKDGSWKFVPKRNDGLLRRYNKFISRVWRANTDFSAITSKEAVSNYISKYASKGEHSSESYADLLNRLIQENESDLPALRTVRQLLMSSLAERNYSAQETMHLIMGWPLFHASRSMVSMRDDWERFGSGDNNLVSKYSTRCDSLQDLSLFDFARFFRCSSGRVIRREKECIVRVIPYIKLSDDGENSEEYYKLQCKLHVVARPVRDCEAH